LLKVTASLIADAEVDCEFRERAKSGKWKLLGEDPAG
jgi:hypothetical protein